MPFDKHKNPANIARRQEALAEGYALLIRGKTYREIAETIGYTDQSNCRKALLGYIAKRTQEMNEVADQARTVIVDTYDTLSAAIIGKALDGDLQAYDRVLRTQLQKQRLLGLDRGPVLEVTQSVVTDAQVDTDLATLRNLLMNEARKRAGDLPELAALEAATTPPPAEQPIDAELADDTGL